MQFYFRCRFSHRSVSRGALAKILHSSLKSVTLEIFQSGTSSERATQIQRYEMEEFLYCYYRANERDRDVKNIPSAVLRN